MKIHVFATILALFPFTRTEDIAKEFGISVGTVKHMAKVCRVKKNESFRSEINRRNGQIYAEKAVMLTALALVNSYIDKGICLTPAFEMNSDIKLIDQYQKLFQSDWWMGFREDMIQFQIEDFFRGERNPMNNVLRLETEYFIKDKGLALALATEGTQEHINKKNQKRK